MPCIYIIGVYVVLKGRRYANNSYIQINDIGKGQDNALLCFTDLSKCCKSELQGLLGEWFYPNRSAVHLIALNTNFYRNRGPNVIRLHWRNYSMTPTGEFCCVVPDAASVNITICVNIGTHSLT